MMMRRMRGRIGDFVLKDISAPPTLSNVGMIIAGGPGLLVEQAGILATRPINMPPRLFMAESPIPLNMLGARLEIDSKGLVSLLTEGDPMMVLSSGVPAWFGKASGLTPLWARSAIGAVASGSPELEWMVPAQAVIDIAPAGAMWRCILLGDGDTQVRKEWLSRSPKHAAGISAEIADSLGYSHWHVRTASDVIARACDTLDIPLWWKG